MKSPQFDVSPEHEHTADCSVDGNCVVREKGVLVELIYSVGRATLVWSWKINIVAVGMLSIGWASVAVDKGTGLDTIAV